MWADGRTILDQYRVERELGSGGMATAYLVRQIDSGYALAAKVPHRHLVRTPQARANFANEVQVWISLPSHPHLVQCHFIREVDQVPVVFAEYVPNGTLKSWISPRDRIAGVSHALDLGIQLAEAMSVAQEMGVVHCDLKPANCLMDNSGLLKVGDFGLATAESKSIEKPAKESSFSTDHLCLAGGSPSYCSPEQFDGRPLDSRTDIWSFGVTLLEVLTKICPGLGPAAPLVLQDARGLEEFAKVSTCLWELLDKLLQPDPAARLGSFSEIRDRLRELYQQNTGRPYPRKFPRPAPSSPDEVAPEQSKRGQAEDILRRAARLSGRNVAIRISVPKCLPGRRAGEADNLAVIHILREAINLYCELIAAMPSENRFIELSDAFALMAESQTALGDFSSAIKTWDQSTDWLSKVLRQTRSSRLALRLAARIQSRAICRCALGELDQALKDYDRGIVMFKGLDNLSLGSAVSNSIANLYRGRSIALLGVRRLEEARRDADRAVHMLEPLEGQADCLLDLALSYRSRGVIFRRLGSVREAIEDYSRAIQLCESPNARGCLASNRNEVLVSALIARAAAYLTSSQLRCAVEDSDAAEAILKPMFASGSHTCLLNLSQVYTNRGLAFRQLHKVDEAVKDMEQSIEIREQLVEQRGMTNLASELARSYANKVLLLLDTDQTHQALAVAERALSFLETHADRNRRSDLAIDLARLRVLRGAARGYSGQREQSLHDLAQGISEYERLLKTGAPDVFDGLIQALILRLGVCLGLRPRSLLDVRTAVRTLTKQGVRPDVRYNQALRSEMNSSLGRLSESATVQLPANVTRRLAKLADLLQVLGLDTSQNPTDKSAELINRLSIHPPATEP
jgi:serine/threonine protein kinase